MLLENWFKVLGHKLYSDKVNFTPDLHSTGYFHCPLWIFFGFCTLSLACPKQYLLTKMFHGMHYNHSYVISFSPYKKVKMNSPKQCIPDETIKFLP